MQLIVDLLGMATEEDVKFSTPDDPIVDFNSDMDHQTVFAVQLYHRWVLKSLLHNSLTWKFPRVLFIATQSGQDPNSLVAKKRETLRTMLEAQAMQSVVVLRSIVEQIDTITIPNLKSFVQPTESSLCLKTKWTTGTTIQSFEFKCQIHFELAQFFMFHRDHDAARHHLTACLPLFSLFEKSTERSGYCKIDSKVVFALASACQVDMHHLVPASALPDTNASSLIDRFRESKWHHYQDIIEIVELDNVLRVIPVAERDVMEVELQQSISSGSLTVAKHLLMRLQMLNALRRILSHITPTVDILHIFINHGEKAISFFLESIRSLMLNDCLSEQERKHLGVYIFDILVRSASAMPDNSRIAPCILANEAIQGLLSQSELAYVNNLFKEDMTLAKLSLANDLPPLLIRKCPRLQVVNLQNRLTETYDGSEIRPLLEVLLGKELSMAWVRSNTRWEVPIPLQSAILSLPKGFAQDFICILLAKSKELCNKKEFEKAIALLELADVEAKSCKVNNAALLKISRLINWEALVVRIKMYISSYPCYSQDICRLTASCKACVAAASAGESVIPRSEVLDNCAIALLNLGQWEILVLMEKRLVYIELAAALASACQEATKYNGSKKFPKEAWDLIVPVFGTVSQKRNNAGTLVAASGTGSGLTISSLVRFLLELREPTVVAVATSLLARLHNVLRDEPTLEIACTYSGLWPAMISNSSSYNGSAVFEVLHQITTNSRNFMTDDFTVLRLLGDLSYASTDWAEAVRFYLEAIAVATDFYTQPITKPAVDDFVIKRIIRCCTQLNCYTQAAALCQCLEDIDYATAFRCLSETKNLHCADAMDAYYPCIWDMTILEYLVNHHSKRGEIQRKQQVMKIMGLLELNCNNNEEIQSEAAKVRKGRLFRALLEQYCVSNKILHS